MICQSHPRKGSRDTIFHGRWQISTKSRCSMATSSPGELSGRRPRVNNVNSVLIIISPCQHLGEPEVWDFYYFSSWSPSSFGNLLPLQGLRAFTQYAPSMMSHDHWFLLHPEMAVDSLSSCPILFSLAGRVLQRQGQAESLLGVSWAIGFSVSGVTGDRHDHLGRSFRGRCRNFPSIAPWKGWSDRVSNIH